MDSRRRANIPKMHFGWIKVEKLEATTIHAAGGSLVCKKELSSNRINDLFASIYRIPGTETRGENTLPPGRARTNSSNCLRRTTMRQLFFHVVLLPRNLLLFLLRAENIICFLRRCRELYIVAGSLTARAHSFTGRVCKSCFRCLHPFARMRETSARGEKISL